MAANSRAGPPNPPGTSTTSAVIFSGVRNELFEPGGNGFQFKNEKVGNAFAEANQTRLWSSRSIAASASTKRTIVYGLGVAAIVIVVVYSLINDLLS